MKRGAKDISILAPVVVRSPRADEDTNSETEEQETEKMVVAFRGATVFDVADTDGAPLPDIHRAHGEPGVYLERLREHIVEQGITIEHAECLAGADGMSCGGKILLRKTLPPAEVFSVLVHELSHEMLHHGEDVPANKTVRETEAEAIAFVVCEAIGIDSRLASADYVLLYDGNVETLRQSLHRIRRTAHRILDAIVKEDTAGVEPAEGVEVVAEAA